MKIMVFIIKDFVGLVYFFFSLCMGRISDIYLGSF